MGSWLRQSFWWLPLAFAVLVAGVGSYAYRILAESTREGVREDLETILETDVAALGFWVDIHKAALRSAARDVRLRWPTLELLNTARTADDPGAALRGSRAMQEVAEVLDAWAEEHGYRSWGVMDRHGIILAANARLAHLVGSHLEVDATLFNRALRESALAAPISDPLAAGPDQASPVLRAGAPISDDAGEVIAVLGCSIPADAGFSEVLQLARAGESGETYAFDRNGLMLSRSRFEDELVGLGLLAKGERSTLRIQIRDPGGDLRTGYQPTLPLLARPLTRMAASAVTGESGFDIDGYPDYRGVPVVGAWTWLPDLDLGITSEIDFAEAYAGLTTVRRSFAAIAATLALAAIGMLAYSILLGRAQSRYEAARQLGRYRILEKIGEGGMGKVYRAEHALLRRSTAVKLLEADRATAEAASRFEREVQAVARLSHPNTIAIYDYGRTPEGAFYYAMEYLEGVTVGDLVAADGAQPEARVLHLLVQAAGSLSEAHGVGLVHRDLKPSNVMVCSRGGMLDTVKVLDFGLVRAVDENLHLTQTQSLTGTPQYLSPEALEAPETVDARSDVYQLGAIAYYLVTGRHVFPGETLVQVLSAHLHSAPVPPSEALGYEISPSLEKLVLRCLAKDPADRPANGQALLEELQDCEVSGVWHQEDARAWWAQWRLEHPAREEESSGSGSLPSGWEIELSRRGKRPGERTVG